MRPTTPPARSRPTPTPTPSKSSGSWTPAEDTRIIQMRNTKPPSGWVEIADALGGGHTHNAVRLRYQRVLKYDDADAGEPLNATEKALLEQAVSDLDEGKDRWFFVAARYTELRKGKVEKEGGARELGKVGVKRWCETLKRKGKEEKKKVGSGKRVKREVEKDADEDEF